MVEIILKNNATINEIIGDSILVIFGAPQQMVDRCQRAVACAIEMQNAMREVNSQNQARGLPLFDIGIGLNESQVIVGNIGSKKRTKYGVVGSGVNLASRIESFTVGGQILISDSVYNEIGNLLLINHQMKVHPKGSKEPLTVYEVSGISGQYNLSLKNEISNPVALEREIPVYYVPIEENQPSERKCSGALLQLSCHSAVMRLQMDHDLFTNLKFNLSEAAKELSCKDFYGKVVGVSDTNNRIYTVRFTSLPPAVGDYFQAVTDRS
jgi:adenylate cyclase